MPRCAASSGASTGSTASSSSPCAAPTTRPPGSGRPATRNQAELEARIAEQVDAEPALLVDRRLAIDGHDLQRELGMSPGPEIGEVLDRLTEIVLDDPTRTGARRSCSTSLRRR